jgi:hypothetical protein
MNGRRSPMICPVCERDAHTVEGYRILCEFCVLRLATAIKECARAWTALEGALALPTVAITERLTGGKQRPLPFRPAVVELRDLIRHDLASSISAIAQHDERDSLPSRDQPLSMTAWLADRLDRVASADCVITFLEAIEAHVRAARDLVDLPRQRAQFSVAGCAQINAGSDGQPPCTGTIIAQIPRDDDRPAVLRCEKCSKIWTPDQWLRIGRRVRAAGRPAARLLDSRAAAVALGVAPRTVGRMVASGTLHNYGDQRHIRIAYREIEGLLARRILFGKRGRR